MNIEEKVEQFVAEESNKPTSKYGAEPYEFHFKPVVKYGKILSDKYKADEEIVILACWLHDIGSIVEGREDHHLSGARIAREKLEEFGYPADRTEQVVNCIKNHRGSQKNNRDTKEEKIVAEADALSNFDNIAGIFKAAFVYENQTQADAPRLVMEKLENKYRKLHFGESRKLIEPKYQAAKVLFGGDWDV